MKVEIEVRDELFHFIHFRDWVDHAQRRFKNHGHTWQTTICVDAAGTICSRGAHFTAALYPVRVYAIDDPPHRPTGVFASEESNAADD